MTVADPTEAVFSPAVGARTRVVVRKKLPGCSARTVILADRSPLPLGKIGPPALPVLLSNARFFEPAVFRGLVSWHGWVALSRETFRLWSHFPQKNSSVDLRTRACSGKPRGRQTDLMH